jgi:hydroxymethylpyrimidine kinase/phosphomethylpyrimidine kinase
LSHTSIVALTIGGSSTTGAAGVEADLKTFAVLGVHSAVVITAIASQNTKGVQKILYLPGGIVSQQMDSVFSDMNVRAVKIGMLGNSEITEAVLDGVKKWHARNIVLDPVMTAQSDSSWLVEKGSIQSMRELLELCTVVTPNSFEAERLTGVRVRSTSDAKRAAKALRAGGAEAVVVKGVRDGGMISDITLHKNFRIFRKKMVGTGTHGGGCCFSSALAASLAKGLGIEGAFEASEKFIDYAIGNSVRIGKGVEAVEPMAMLMKDAERCAVISDVEAALGEVENCMRFSSIIPEVGTNIVYALPHAKTVEDVAGVVGRVRNAMGRPESLEEVRFGASSHLARAVLSMMEFDSSKRAAVNVRLTEANLKSCRKLGLRISYYERSEEPKSVKRREGATIPWGIESAVKRAKGIPDVVYHRGEVGKEPSLIIFGNTAREVVKIAMKLVPPALLKKS